MGSAPILGPNFFYLMCTRLPPSYIIIGTEEDIGGGSFILYQEQERTILFDFDLMACIVNANDVGVGSSPCWR